MTPDNGPVIDWLREKWDALLALLTGLLHRVGEIPGRVEAAADRVVFWLIVVGVGVAVVYVLTNLLHAWMTKPAAQGGRAG